MSFEQMRVYQAAELLDSEVQALIATIPGGHSRDIDQLQRATASIPYNIAEAYGWVKSGQRSHHLEIARASTDETRAVLRRLVARRALSHRSIVKAVSLTTAIAKMLTSWIAKLQGD